MNLWLVINPLTSTDETQYVPDSVPVIGLLRLWMTGASHEYFKCMKALWKQVKYSAQVTFQTWKRALTAGAITSIKPSLKAKPPTQRHIKKVCECNIKAETNVCLHLQLSSAKASLTQMTWISNVLITPIRKRLRDANLISRNNIKTSPLKVDFWQHICLTLPSYSTSCDTGALYEWLVMSVTQRIQAQHLLTKYP